MNKCYYRIVWENYPSDRTPLNEQNLNKIDAAADEMDNRIISLDSTKFDKSEAQLLVKYIEYDENTGIFKITHYNGASYEIDTLLEKLAINFDYDHQTQRLIITLSDGEVKYVDLSALITQYEFVESGTILFVVDNSGKVSAKVKEGSIEEKHLQPNYLADIKVEVAKAESSATAAEASKTAAAASASTASSKASEASTSATSAANSATTATQKATSAATSATNAANSASTATEKASEAATSATNAANSATSASNSAATATNKANASSTSASQAATSATNADAYSKKSQSYAVGSGDVRPNEATDNARYYYEKTKDIYENFESAGNVTGVKGNAESSYRIGNVNLTAANVGALPISGGTMNDNAFINLSYITDSTYDRNLFINGRDIYFSADDNGYFYESRLNEEGLFLENSDGPDGANIKWSGVNVWGYDDASCYISSDRIYFYDEGKKLAARLSGVNGNEFEITLGTNGYKYYITNEMFTTTSNGYADLGASNHRWNNIYAANGTIQTSDRTKKTEIADLSDDKSKAFIMGLTPVSYKMTEGTSGRTHYGLIAQDVEDLMETLSIDSKDFAGFIKSPKVIRKDTDEDGNPLKKPTEEIIEGEYDYALRYDEFIAPIIKVIQSQQREIEELKNKIK